MVQSNENAIIALVTFGEDIEGGGIAHYAHQGAKQVAETYGLALKLIETTDEDALEAALAEVFTDNCRAVVTIGLQAGEMAERLAVDHPATEFVAINFQPQVEADNLEGLPVVLTQLEDLEDLLVKHLSIRLERDTPKFWREMRKALLEWNLQSLLIPLLAIFSALVIGAFVIAGFNPEVWEAFNEGFGRGMLVAFQSVFDAYIALWNGSIGNPVRIVNGIASLIQTGETRDLVRSLSPLMESLRRATPYILTGLSVALGFRCGLFNIGAEGQYFIGGLTSVFVGYAIVGLPWYIHLPLAVVAGFIGGAFWAAIAGFLKAKTGAHEVINTIMLNYIAFRLAEYMLQIGGPMARPGENLPISPEIQVSARLPQFFPENPAIRLNMGLFLALLMVFAVWYLLFKTPIGFEIRTVGASPRAARTAGMNIGWNFVLAMGLSGGLAGLAGAHDVLGVLRYMPNAFQSGYGFDAIALALLGKSHPVGVLLASLLFGMLRAGAVQMQGAANVPIDIIAVLQGLIIVFVAAPELIRVIYRLRVSDEAAETLLTRGWGGNV